VTARTAANVAGRGLSLYILGTPDLPERGSSLCRERGTVSAMVSFPDCRMSWKTEAMLGFAGAA